MINFDKKIFLERLTKTCHDNAMCTAGDRPNCPFKTYRKHCQDVKESDWKGVLYPDEAEVKAIADIDDLAEFLAESCRTNKRGCGIKCPFPKYECTIITQELWRECLLKSGIQETGETYLDD